MNPNTQFDRDSDRIGRFTISCRYVCGALVAAPFIYVNLVTDGDAYHFLALVLLSPIAGIVLIGNSLFSLVRYRNIESYWIGIAFILIGLAGGFVIWHYLPEFRM